MKRYKYIGFLLMAMLLMGGMANSASADVTYIILTKEFNVRNAANTADYRTNIRLEALRCTSDGSTVYLPLEFRSPLAKNFKYWKTPTVTTNTKLYDDTGTSPKTLQTTYNIFTAVADEMTEGSTLASNGNPTTIYVTYDYDEDNDILKLDGAHKYNITLNSGANKRFLCFNKNRNNRPAAAKATTVTAEDLISNDFVQNVDGFDGTKMVHYQFYLCGEDPYNITIMTAYEGSETFNEKLAVEGTAYKKPYAGSTIFAKLQNNNNNDGTANMWLSPDAHRHYKSTSDATVYDEWEGFYRSDMNPIFNAVAVLPKGTGYFFVASKLNQNGKIYQPNASGYYATLSDDGKNPRMIFKAIASITPMEPDPITEYIFKVKTPFGNVISAEKKWTDAYASDLIKDHIPNALLRKYVTIEGAYADEALTTPLTTYADANEHATTEGGSEKRIVWLKYTVSSTWTDLVETLPVGGSYTNAKWYTIRMNNENQYIVKKDGSNFITGGGSNTNLHQGENSAEAQVAFMGDPYELKVLNRAACEADGANRYIGCPTASATGTQLSVQTGSSDISSWEMIYELGNDGTVLLRQFNSTTGYWGWNYGSSNNPPAYSTSASSRIKIVKLEKKPYVYHIINSAGDVAVKMTEDQDVGTPLRLSNIPELIRSPFLALPGVNLFYYWSKADYDADQTAVAGGSDRTRNKTNASYDPASEGYDIYVCYTGMAAALASTRVHFHTNQFFNVVLNGQYLYYNSGDIYSKYPIDDAEAGSEEYKWRLEGQDPYNMKVYNSGAYGANNSKAYINTTFTNEADLTFDAAATAASFVALSGTLPNSFEVMAATGDTLDIATNYYHIGRKTDNSVKMYNNAEAHGYASIRFMLTLTDADAIYYHLIDKSHTDLLQSRSRYEKLFFPYDYRSPLVAQYHYYPTKADADASTNELTENASIADLKAAGTIADRDGDGNPDVYITYETSSAYDLLNKKIMYLLKYETGTPFHPEDGKDGLETSLIRPVYPYCNGDCNFFVYGQAQFDLQQEGAASTRTRWAWFLESANNDPYHVKICSRQTETFNNNQARAYFRTYAETFGDTKHVITTLTWPEINSIAGTEYMVLGSVGQFQLVTTNAIAVDLNDDGDTSDEGESNERRTVNSFEQYWKTWDTIRKKVLGDSGAKESQTDPNTVPATPATAVATAAGKNNRTYLTDIMNWHSYEHWAYAKRWNGYNISGAKSKGWEPIEHWYQTVAMGEGYFDLVPIVIDPALILLDQHGWEVMRKPLPSSEDDPQKEAKHAALRVYDSPMVEEYHFWTKSSKRSGFHQYYNLSQRISVDGEVYTSTSLGTLPPIDATNVKDAKGNILDQYVTYVIKDEYKQSLGKPFLIQQGTKYASYDGSTLTTTAVPSGGMSQYIIDNEANLTEEGSKKTDLWYLNPNANIDIEMGYNDAVHDWTNDYTVTDFSESGFDPYNIQISSVNTNAMYFMTNATGATLHDGKLDGTYDADPAVAMGSSDANVSCIWYDSRRLSITNKTFMAVQDELGNMQLMPRFDQTTRMKDFSALVSSSDAEIEKTYTKLYRPIVYDYRIIDNAGDESLRYKRGGDLVPETPEWFKSRLAKDYVYCANTALTDTIKASLEGATLTNHIVYVRYSYDSDADWDKIMQGKWLTMTLNNKDAIYNDGLKQGTPKPNPVDGNKKEWQWKLLVDPQSEPDPYAVRLYNRNQAGAATSVGDKTKFALLSWYDNNGIDPGIYTLAVAGTETSDVYEFVNGIPMSTSDAANTLGESGITGSVCAYAGDGMQVVFNDDVIHSYTYKVYTNKSIFAVSAEQSQIAAEDHEFVPVLPDEIKSPLLHSDQFVYYGAEADMGTAAKELTNLYGLYEDDVYVRYSAYDLKTSEYKVPNVRNATGSTIAKGDGSNDAALDISGELIYNIIWRTDNMMASSDGSSISDGGARALDGTAPYVWQFAGNDPYAIQIKHKNSGKYAVGTGSLAATATSTFMLLPADDWDYGMLQVTGGTNRLSGYGQTTVAGDPTKFIIFGLSTNKVIYHLVMVNVDHDMRLPYRTTKGGVEGDTTIVGSTMRDLTTGSGATYQLGSTINGMTYCIDYGHVTLGDTLLVPETFRRPNCKYFFFVEGIYTDNDCDRSTHLDATLDEQYRGLQITRMGSESDLLGKTVRINIVYAFDDGLPSNNGSHFVTNTAGTEWYTFETSDETPYMANFTYKDNKLRSKEGRVGHYTNEFLWSPVGDPYGFVMYNRYVYRNGGETTKVMTTADAPAADADLIMKDYNDTNYQIFELLPGSSSGDFKVQTQTIPGSGTPYYIDNHEGTMKLKTSTTTEWHFGLDQTLFDPYYVGAGNVGGLTTTPKAGQTKSGVQLYEEATNIMEKQAVVYNPDNIVDFTPGYYRIFNQPNSQGIKTPRYLSGYTHLIELTGDGENTDAAIPMHFYEIPGVTTSYEVLGSGFTFTHATSGAIPITGPEYDPASIFYISSGSGNAPYTMQTQGLYVKDSTMTATSGEANNFYVADIGGATVLIHDGAEAAERKYLHYRQSVGNIYDVKFEIGSVVDEDDAAKWCMEPANKKGLLIETHSGGEEATLTTLWYYASLCVPFDLLIADKRSADSIHSSNAYTCVEAESPWNTEMLHPKPIGKYNTGTYANNDYFVPAGTPVLFSTKRATQYIKATIPTTTPSTPITTIFSYEYLEQLLTPYDDNRRVYVFGPKMEGTLTLNEETGVITAVLPSLGNTNVGFHLNANPNKEAGLARADWTRNNYYVLHNKIYYRAPASTPAPGRNDIVYVPVNFGDEDEEQPDEQKGNTSLVGESGIYDILGRRYNTLPDAPGIYIVNGQKIIRL